MIIEKEITEIQLKWAQAIVKIGEFKNTRADCIAYTQTILDELYNFNQLLFKPTKANQIPFRSSKKGALSYFIGGDTDFSEDKGFALQPWVKVRFENHAIKIIENVALVCGHYFFTDVNGSETKVEYSFAYLKIDGQLKIELHHSSLPYC